MESRNIVWLALGLATACGRPAENSPPTAGAVAPPAVTAAEPEAPSAPQEPLAVAGEAPAVKQNVESSTVADRPLEPQASLVPVGEAGESRSGSLTEPAEQSVAVELPSAAPEALPESPASEPRERFLLLTPGGPMVVDLVLVIRDDLPLETAAAGKPFSLRSSNQYRSDNRSRSPVRLLLDQDRDGAITTAEMEQASRLLASQDANDDGLLTVEDLAGEDEPMIGEMRRRSLTSEPDTAIALEKEMDWGRATFVVQEFYAYGDRITDLDWPHAPELFAFLDADGDQQLAGSEIRRVADAPPHLTLRARFGRDDAEQPASPELTRIEMADFLRDRLLDLREYRNRLSLTLPQCEVEFFVNEDPALSRLDEVAENQFRLFDTDGNNYLDADELPEQLPGYEIEFSDVDADGDEQVDLNELSEFLRQRQAGFATQVRAQAADQRDALFTALDEDGNGRLTSREVQAAPATLRRLDRNQDARLQSHEIPGSMVVGFVRGNPQQDGSLYVMPPSLGTSEAASALPRWFTGMDANGDGEVSRREFLGTVAQFSNFDRNQDGFVSPDEL